VTLSACARACEPELTNRRNIAHGNESKANEEGEEKEAGEASEEGEEKGK